MNFTQNTVVTVNYDSIGVDVPEDVIRVEKIISHGWNTDFCQKLCAGLDA